MSQERMQANERRLRPEIRSGTAAPR